MKLEPLEKDIQSSILNYLTLRGHYVYRQNTGATKFEGKNKTYFVRFGTRGAADITGIAKNGRRIDIEVKRKSNKLTPDQTEYLAQMSARGGYAMVAYSVDDVIGAGL